MGGVGEGEPEEVVADTVFSDGGGAAKVLGVVRVELEVVVGGLVSFPNALLYCCLSAPSASGRCRCRGDIRPAFAGEADSNPRRMGIKRRL